VQEMGVQPADFRRQLGRQDQRLAEPPGPVDRRIAAEIGPPAAAGGAIAREPPGAPPAAQAAERLVQDVFGQIENRRLDLPMDGMDGAVGRMAQRDDADVEAARLQPEDLLGDEGLAQPRIALEDEGDRCGLAG
jgi:hypothetical protein